MTQARWLTLLAAGAITVSACGSTGTLSPTRTSEFTPTTSASAPATATNAPQRKTSTTTSTIPEDPWEIDVVSVSAYRDADLEFGIEEIITSVALIEATVVSIGDPETGRWCCGNPPFQVDKIEVLGGEFSEEIGGWLKGTQYQSLDKTLNPGDRITILLRDGQNVVFVFAKDEGLAHPAPAHHREAIDAMRVREAASAGGWQPIDYSPLRAVTDVWERYHTDWWGSMDQRVALALSGVPEYPVICSAADLGAVTGDTDYPPASAGLPIAVSRTRESVVAAASACDFEGILALTGSTDGEDTDSFWWSGGSSPENFIEADRRYGAMRELVLALTNTAFAREIMTVNKDSGKEVDMTFFLWPSAFVILNGSDADGGLSASDLLGDEEAARVAALSAATVDTLNESTEIVGGYAWFRTAIDATGRWRFALSGD